LRLMGPIIAVLLAITMAIFPISMPRAAAPGVHGHALTLETHTHDGVGLSCDHGASVTCGDHESANHDADSPSCCGMTVCHAFQISAAPDVLTPCMRVTSVSVSGDEQVGGITPGGLDRPPRTV
jgi:hypothetical protein